MKFTFFFHFKNIDRIIIVIAHIRRPAIYYYMYTYVKLKGKCKNNLTVNDCARKGTNCKLSLKYNLNIILIAVR